ncbi:MAG: uroporphyrinogen-III synthase [Leptolyngbyaceae cyanobacterium MO_188.B28]|nr:uroporphyrinogen-III synthase [Leptolyngbyaceae cyanobacterium MO_188.B28]
MSNKSNPSLNLQSLNGRTILVTRAVGQSDQFSQQLRQRGANVIELPALEIKPPSDWEPLDQQLDRISSFDWLILTSANAVDFFLRRLIAKGYSTQALSSLKIAVVGRKTALQLEAHGLTADFIPPKFISDSLIEHFPNRDRLAGTQILYPCLENDRRDLLITELSKLGAIVLDRPAYRSACPETIPTEALNAFKQKVDVVTFASPKTARCFSYLLEQAQDALGEEPQHILKEVAIASIGPLTSSTCQTLFGRVDIQPQEYSLNGLTSALVKWVQSSRLSH